MIKRQITIIFYLICMLFNIAALAEKNYQLMLLQSTSAISAKGAFSFGWLNGKRQDIDLDLGFRYKYFLLDSFTFDAQIENTIYFVPEVRNSIAVDIGFSYIFTTPSIIYPYIGALTGIGYIVWAAANIPLVQIKPEVGMLIAIAENWALDIGLKANLAWGILLPPNIKFEKMDFAIAYFGATWFI
jgi:hypothetical protein